MEEVTLHAFRRLRASGDPALRDRLTCRHMPLVGHLARRFARPGVPLEDLVQVGYVGLINAVDHFDPDRRVKFETYARH
ncbi:MAG: sigma-70 family RNA polymerase sigma factor, partial [Armatimonadetes bacterium]|nr:sigma-70 family RNA polymerase sigma factor [Armatimonadota bacterium]